MGVFHAFHHIKFWVGNAKISASYYVTRMGFEYVAYKGLETGERQVASHVIKNGKVIFEICSGYTPEDNAGIGESVKTHGDSAKDVAFSVDNARGIWEKAVSRGAVSVQEPIELKDEFGSVIIASIKTYGNVNHTFIQNVDYTGPFLPTYKARDFKDPVNKVLPPVELGFIDHVVGNQPVGDMVKVADWYTNVLDWHRFWSVDDSVLHTDYSSLSSIVVADFDENVKMPINEPAPGKKVSQI